MRCPKCGAFMPDDTKECLMCGADITAVNNDNNFEPNNNNIFGSGNDFRSPDRGGFNNSNYGNFNNIDNQKFKPKKMKKKIYLINLRKIKVNIC